MNYITRPQAEALLTLAEALEACERKGIKLESVSGINLVGDGIDRTLWASSSINLRLAVNDLVPRNGR